MDSHGLHSIYHSISGEDFGKESIATFYWRFKVDKPFFIDYAFSSIEPKSFSIGDWEKDISDHRPLSIELFSAHEV